jgi:hypothetical protein
MTNPLYNPTALKSLPSAKNNGRAEAVLIEYDINGKQEKPLWLFLINPATLKFSGSADYGSTTPHAAKAPTLHYNGASGEKLTISNILLSTHCLGKTVKPLIEGLRALLRAKPENNQFAPPVLMFRWGKRRFGPCVLTDLDWDESAWLDGDPAKAVLNITLQEIARPLTKAEKEAKARVKDSAQAKKREKQGKPPLPLTDRQRKEASEKAKEFLKANNKSWAADIQAAIAKNNYKLSTDADTGDVTMTDGQGKSLGVVLRSLGDGNQRAEAKTTTLPLAQGAKHPEIKPKTP